MSKAVDLSSNRQRVIATLYNEDRPMRAAEVIKILKADGIDVSKTIHSYLQAFKGAKTPKVTHNAEANTYELTESGRAKFEADMAEAKPRELVEA